MNIYLVNILLGIGSIVLGYLFGSIPNGVIIGRVFFHKDPRDYGSHNSGGTNVGRVFSKRAGVATIILDMLKIILPIYVTWSVLLKTPLFDYIGAPTSSLGAWYPLSNGGQGAAPLYYWTVGLFGLLGHCFSIFLRFKGGKAVASFLGIDLFCGWIFLILAAVSFGGTFAKERMVSLASILASIAMCVTAWIVALVAHFTPWDPGVLAWTFFDATPMLFGFEFAVMNTFGAIIVIVRHKENIKRIRSGTESRNPWSSAEKK